ncbi:MAG TPA: hypothetical protein PLL71_11715 [Agriterribacter sp.]|nr:hypothetical protein [Agriterribacter sp.]HRQ51163.1 hypothetical protein [Agriterribacter sp.]
MRKQQRNEAEITVAQMLHQGSSRKTRGIPCRQDGFFGGFFGYFFFAKKVTKRKKINKPCPSWHLSPLPSTSFPLCGKSVKPEVVNPKSGGIQRIKKQEPNKY